MEISKQIIESCINNEHKGQKALYELSYSYLMKICWRYSSSKEEAVEYLNIGFCKILTGLEKKPNNTPYKPWASKIVVNSIIDEFRRSKKYKENIVLAEQSETDLIELEHVINLAVNNLNVDDLYKTN